MKIDWFTFAAQICNFTVLVLLLRHFLYGRILGAMDRRENNIAARMEEARDREADAENKVEEYRNKTAVLDRRSREMLAQAEQDANRRRQELLVGAQHEISVVKARWEAALEEDQNTLLAGLRTIIARDVCRTAGRVLKDMADAELEAQIVLVFLQRLTAATGPQGGDSFIYLQQSNDRILVRSAFALAPDLRQRIIDEIHNRIRKNAVVQFEHAADIMCGIELISAGNKLSWTIEGYLQAMEKNVMELLGRAREP
jgi:F-type H+-transporting ATPase subunit b